MSRRAFAVVTDRGSVVRTDVLEQYALKAHSRQEVTQDNFQGTRGLLTPRYDPTALQGLLELNTAHAAACRQKAQDTAGLGWRFDPATDDADPAERERLEEWFDDLPPPASALLDDDASSVFEACALDFETTGRGVFELVRVDHAATGPLETIVHVPAEAVRVHRDGKRFVVARGGKRHWFRWVGADFDVDYESGQTAPLGSLRPERRGHELVWWRNPHPRDRVYGAPDVIPAVGAILGDRARRDYNLDFFANHGIPAYLVSVTGDFDPGPKVNADGEPDPGGMTAIEWQLERHFKDLREHPHSTLTLVLPTRDGDEAGKVDVKIERVATEVKEASFRLYRTDNREEVLSSHRMSAAIAGVFDAGAANREALAQYKRSVIQPRQRKLEQVVNRYIVGAFGITAWRWRLATIDTRDLQRELDMWLRMWETRAVTLRQLVHHFADPLGLPEPDPQDRSFDVRAGGADGQAEQVEAALLSLRDDLVRLAAKDAGNGHRPDLDAMVARAVRALEPAR